MFCLIQATPRGHSTRRMLACELSLLLLLLFLLLLLLSLLLLLLLLLVLLSLVVVVVLLLLLLLLLIVVVVAVSLQNGGMFTLLDVCVSSLRRGHANLLCIVPNLTDDPRRESIHDLSLYTYVYMYIH